MNIKKKYHAPDYTFLITASIIIIFGLIMLSSSGVVSGYTKHSDGYFFVKHQLIFGIIPGFLLFYFFYKIDYKIWKKFALPIFIFSILILSTILFPNLRNSYNKGAESWIKLSGRISFQPSEFVKITLLLYLASWMEKQKKFIKTFTRGMLPFFIIVGSVLFFILLEPDFGTLLIILATAFALYFAAGANIWHLIFTSLFGTIIILLMINFSSYRTDRFTAFLHPEKDPQNTSYHINQSFIAISTGGFWGKGFGQSVQKFAYLPEPFGDSIFAIIAEELGFLLSLALLLAFIYLIYRGFYISKKAPDEFGKFLAVGIILWFTIQAIVNIGGMVGIMPITGVPLPLISYGGSALIACMGALGIIANISKQTT